MINERVFNADQDIPEVENGCAHHNDCFTCPFPDCIAGDGIHAYKVKSKRRAHELKKEGLDKRQIASEMGKSIRTIDRYFKE